jgi:hypothetical protein
VNIVNIIVACCSPIQDTDLTVTALNLPTPTKIGLITILTIPSYKSQSMMMLESYLAMNFTGTNLEMQNTLKIMSTKWKEREREHK